MSQKIKDLTQVKNSIAYLLVEANTRVLEFKANTSLTNEKKFQLSMDEVRKALKFSFMNKGCSEEKYKSTLTRINGCCTLDQLIKVLETIIEAGKKYIIEK